MYAINGWASWGFYNTSIFERRRDADIYINVKLRLFNCIASLFCGRIKKSLLPQMNQELRDTLIEHSLLLPPSESTYALHEIIHVCSQIEKTGPPRFNCLFMFERVNLFLKRMIKNKHHHMASIIKGYASEEFICQTIGFNFKCLTKVVEIMSCMPSNYNIVKKILNSFNNLYVDENNVMYSIPNSRVHELRGRQETIHLNQSQSDEVMRALASLARTDSVLGNYTIYTHVLYLTAIYSYLTLF
jgi:hypothetical protein